MKSEPRFVGIIGHHIAHTLSPAMHTAAFRDLHLPFAYGVFDVTPEFLPALVASLRKHGCAGANVTIPHKQNVIPLLDEIQEDAAALGAVNTIVNRNGRLIGYNTDISGVKYSLDPVKEKIRSASVLILGAGGGARAAVYTVSKFFSPRNVRLHNRSAIRADKIVVDFKKSFPGVAYENISSPERLRSALAESALVVNTTSLGMSPDIDALPLPGTISFSNQQIIFDIIYNPIETALLRRAKMQGAQTINGVEMFVHQGADAFELWTGKTFPVDRALEVVTRALTT
jgi:shikimate dehydrogenase